MSFRIERSSEGKDTILRLSGRMRAGDLESLRKELGNEPRLILDLTGVSVVDVAIVRFLNVCESRGLRIENGPSYIKEWMRREREGEE
jgi:anti-anti-sigma regulatory factor